MKKDMRAYELMGLPGCFGSVDGTHIKWRNAPVGRSEEERLIFCSGYKDGVTLNFQCIVSTRTLRIVHCSKGYPGNNSDSIIFKWKDEVTRRLMTSQTRSNMEYTILQTERLNGDGEYIIVRRKCFGGYLLSDQGYFDGTVLMHPISQTILIKTMENMAEGDRLTRFSNRIESARTDIEDVFGVLKLKFSVLNKIWQRYS